MTQITGLGIGRILAVVGLILTILLVVLARLAMLPDGLLFGLAFLAILL